MGFFSLLISFKKNNFVFSLNFRGRRNYDAGVAIATPANDRWRRNYDASVAIAVPTGLQNINFNIG